MNTQFFIGFQPNSNKKVHNLININTENPFTSLSQSSQTSPHYINKSLLNVKLLSCEKHEIFALLDGIDSYKNVWRIMEILHIAVPKKYGKLPESWHDMIDLLKSPVFHRDITNIQSGQRKIKNLCYVALEHLIHFMVDGEDVEPDIGPVNLDITKKTKRTKKPVKVSRFIFDNKTNYHWQDISLKLIQIVNMLTMDRECTCNDFRIYDDVLLDAIKQHHELVVRNQLSTWLNKIHILWDNLIYDYNETDVKKEYYRKLDQLFRNPPEKAMPKYAKSIPLSYDLLKEGSRLNYIKRRIHDNRHQTYYLENGEERPNNFFMLGIAEPIPVLYTVNAPVNHCFVCDVNLFKNYYQVNIHQGMIMEIQTDNHRNFIHSIIERCTECKNGKYGQAITNNDMVIMARHYKWMTFYSGFYDKHSILANVPFDVAKLIILLYQQAR